MSETTKQINSVSCICSETVSIKSCLQQQDEELKKREEMAAESYSENQ